MKPYSLVNNVSEELVLSTFEIEMRRARSFGFSSLFGPRNSSYHFFISMLDNTYYQKLPTHLYAEADVLAFLGRRTRRFNWIFAKTFF
jgi:hypothetical protein